jgi:hypothetical protein
MYTSKTTELIIAIAAVVAVVVGIIYFYLHAVPLPLH